MNTQEQLQYISNLRDRVINQSNKNGVTKWALGVSILYLLFQAFPNIALLKYGEIPFEPFALMFTHVIGLAIGATWLYAELHGSSEFTRFDYRFTTASFNNLTLATISFLCFEGGYALSCIGLIMVDYFRPDFFGIHLAPFERLTFQLSGIVFFIITLCLIYFWHKTWQESRADEVYPMGMSLNTNTSKTKKTFLNIGFLSTLLLFVNGIYIAFPTTILSIENYKSTVLLSFQLSLALCAIGFFIRSIKDSTSVRSLEKLERDILLHGLSEEEVLARLQAHYFGNDFFTWLDKRLQEVTGLSDEISFLVESESDFKAELEKLDINLKFERKGRVDIFKEQLTTKLEDYKNKIAKIDKCLVNILTFAKSDQYLSELIKDHRNKLDTMFQNDKAKVSVTLSAIAEYLN